MVVMVVMRLMGKRQIGQLQPFELVVTIMLAELAAIPMQDTDVPLLSGIIPIITLLGIQITLATFSLKSQRAREFISGKPSVLIDNGKIVESELEKHRYNITDLMEQVRQDGFFNLSDIQFAVLETGGQLTVIPKKESSPTTIKDFSKEPGSENMLPVTLITDGYIHENNLKKNNLTINWLLEILRKNNISSPKDVLYCTLNTEGQIFIQKKEGSK
jgi:uncharacterized membrane protein YcaP (DUF421 family)